MGLSPGKELSNVSTTSVRTAVVALVILPFIAIAARAARDGVEIVRHDADQRIDVIIDGQPFTSYLWPSTIKKPVLFPIRSAKGTIVTRGVPLEPRLASAWIIRTTPVSGSTTAT